MVAKRANPDSGVVMKHSSPPPAKISVVVANPNPISCKLLGAALEKNNQLRVIDRVSSAAELAASLDRHSPNILLVSSHFQALVGEHFRLLTSLLSGHAEVACVVLADESVPHVVAGAFRAGVRGFFLCADRDLERLEVCLGQVAQGRIWIEPSHLKYLVSCMPEGVASDPAPRRRTTPLLTPREEEVVQLLAEGLRNREIAARMNVSDNTIKNYMFRIFEKLGFSNRVELVLYATAHMAQTTPQVAQA